VLGKAQTETCCCVPCASGVGHLDLNKGGGVFLLTRPWY